MPKKVLIIDDEPSIAESIAMVVEEAGYLPLIGTHPKEGLELIRTHSPALVTTDFMLPGMNGEQFVEAIRADALARQIAPPLILLISAVIAPRIQQVKADAVLSKPFNVDEMITLLQKLLGTDDTRND